MGSLTLSRLSLCGYLILGLCAACPAQNPDAEETPSKILTLEELRDPTTCKACHQQHYDEWASSMHAYASSDPVFLAMNRRGQRETNGELGSFCVQCHAPMALRTGATTDGLNLENLPKDLQGVTCYFCHSVSAVEGTHNNPLLLSEDGVMRGGISNPVDNAAHLSSYSSLHDRREPESAAVCGSCHDVVTPAGFHLERTFLEWQQSIFGQPDMDSFLSCGECHMSGRTEPVASGADMPVRRRHRHLMPGVDIALTPFAGHEQQVAAVQEELDYALEAHLCMDEQEQLTIKVGNIGAGHSFPSGAAHDRRVWVEAKAFKDGEEVWSYGILPQDVPLAEPTTETSFTFFNHAFDSNGNEAIMFWEVKSSEQNLLLAPNDLDVTSAFAEQHQFRVFDLSEVEVDQIEIKVKMRPMALHIIQSLIDSGDLAPSIREAIPTFTLKSTEVTWTAADGFICLPY
jgi:hypothetical protein